MIPAIVDVDWLKDHPEAVLADVRWYLDGRSGRAAYDAGHLPGAVFIDLDTALAAPASQAGGRHPLPDPIDFADAMLDAGISDESTVVAYDDAGGFSAGRLVWMLRTLGINAALLDGGMAVWDGGLSTEEPDYPEGELSFPITGWGPDVVATMDEAVAGPITIDARAGERFRGEGGPTLDARPGHIPGAISIPLMGNMDADQRFLSPDQLRERYEAAGVTDASEAIVYCGSGVSACHDLLAMEHAGLGRARLFVGSWSAYAATERPAATGA